MVLATVELVGTRVTTLVLTSYDELPMNNHLLRMYQILETLYPNIHVTTAANSLPPYHLRCYRTAFINSDAEHVFASELHARAFRELIHLKLGQEYFDAMQAELDFNRNCPPATAIVLQRLDSRSPRKIRNYDVIDRVLKRHGIAYANVTLDATTPVVAQIGVFYGAGLIISSHSSQLKNLVYSGRNTVVIETKAQLYSTAFSDGTEHLGIIYTHSVGHRSDQQQVETSPQRNNTHGKAVILSDYWLDEAIFEHDVAAALEIQRQACGNIWGGV